MKIVKSYPYTFKFYFLWKYPSFSRFSSGKSYLFTCLYRHSLEVVSKLSMLVKSFSRLSKTIAAIHQDTCYPSYLQDKTIEWSLAVALGALRLKVRTCWMKLMEMIAWATWSTCNMIWTVAGKFWLVDFREASHSWNNKIWNVKLGGTSLWMAIWKQKSNTWYEIQRMVQRQVWFFWFSSLCKLTFGYVYTIKWLSWEASLQHNSWQWSVGWHFIRFSALRMLKNHN